MRSAKEVNDFWEEISSHRERSIRSKFPGMTYEDGVIAMIEWLMDSQAPNPLEE